MSIRAAIIGVGGYTGAELWRILLAHPAVTVRLAVSDRLAGARASEVLGGPSPDPDVTVVPRAALDGLAAGAVDVALLATPATASAALAPRFADLGAKVIDLSGAFRLPDPAAYPTWYGFDHPCPDLLAHAHRGVFELSPPPVGAPLVACPGCYPTAATLSLAPFLAAGMEPQGAIVVDAKSGVTGAGRKGTVELSLGEVGESIRPYGFPRHRHAPEMEQLLGHAAPVAFVPHLLPVRRGLLTTAHVHAPAGAPGTDDPQGLLLRAHAGQPFVRVLGDRFPGVRDVVGSNLAAVRAVYDQRTGVLSTVCAIDNLLKGAAGHAVQMLNAVFEQPPTAGLELLTRASG